MTQQAQPPRVALTALELDLAVCRLPPGEPVTDPGSAGFWAVTRTGEETSVVCAAAAAPADATVVGGWMAFVVSGPLDFGLTGILAAVASPLAQAGVPIFAISTFDTDYVLVKRTDEARARAALGDAGHSVVGTG